jgi:hypothetical protein
LLPITQPWGLSGGQIGIGPGPSESCRDTVGTAIIRVSASKQIFFTVHLLLFEVHRDGLAWRKSFVNFVG